MINSISLQTSSATPALHESARALEAAGPSWITIALIVVGVVCMALIILYITFNYRTKLYLENKKKRVSLKPSDVKDESDISGEVNAAIAVALHLYRTQLHDNEDPIITMKRVASTYSPWSSKIYGLTRPPR